MEPRPTRSTLFPYTTLFRSGQRRAGIHLRQRRQVPGVARGRDDVHPRGGCVGHRHSRRHLTGPPVGPLRSEEHTSELQSLAYLVCRLLLEKKKNTHTSTSTTPASLDTPCPSFSHGTATHEIYTLSLHDALPIWTTAGWDSLTSAPASTRSRAWSG